MRTCALNILLGELLMISTLSDLIAQVESSSNPWAIRYEPLHQSTQVFVSRMAAIVGCSNDTARVLCAMSWGLYQIMGDELISLGLKTSPLIYCDNGPAQHEYFSKFLAEKGIADYTLSDIIDNADKRAYFAGKYNGPGNVDAYCQRLLDVYQASL